VHEFLVVGDISNFKHPKLEGSMNNPFQNLWNQRTARKNKEQKNRIDRANDFQVRRDKRRLLTMDYSPMVMEVIGDLRDLIYPGLNLGEEPWECKWFLYRTKNQSRDKEIVFSVTLKLDGKFEPQCFQCERITGKFDFHGGPRFFAESESLSREDLIEAVNKVHPSDTV
jgi:hypothetical protein